LIIERKELGISFSEDKSDKNLGELREMTSMVDERHSTKNSTLTSWILSICFTLKVQNIPFYEDKQLYDIYIYHLLLKQWV